MNTKGQHRGREADSSTGRHRMTIGMAAGLKKGTDSRHLWVALPALLDRVRPVDVWFQINVHRVGVWDVKWFGNLVIMLFSIVFCTVLAVLIVLLLDTMVGGQGVHVHRAVVYITLMAGAAIGIIVAIKLTK
jgi:hypothetical protein